MTDSRVGTPHTYRRRVLAAVLWLLALLWFGVLMAWSALHAFILPRIDDYRGWLQQEASQHLAVPVQIGELDVQGNWLVPWVEARDVVLRDAQGQEALRLPRVVVAFSPWSLLRGRVQQLLIDQPTLDIRRDVQGKLWIAGMPLPAQDDDTAVADWFFAQPEFVIRHGSVRWRDEQRHGAAGPRLDLVDVDVVLRNHFTLHEIRVDATPPQDFGQRLSWRGRFRQTPFHRRGDWQDWRGELYADLPHVDLANLRQWVPMDKNRTLDQGRGALRVWADWERGRPTGLWADLALDTVRLHLGADLPALSLTQVQGRVGAQWQGDDIEFNSQDLRFDTDQGEHWPGGNLRVRWQGESARHGTVQADHLDLEALAQIAQRVPLPEAWRHAMHAGQLRGVLQQLQASWQLPSEGDTKSAPHYAAKGVVSQFHWQRDSQATGVWADVPGLDSAQVDFDVTDHAGKARLIVHDGSLTLPWGLDEPRLALREASAQLAWQVRDGQVAVQFSQGHVTNDDLDGEFSGQWKTGTGAHRLPGLLDLDASLSRGQASAVYRYLPDGLPADVRAYVRDTVLAGDLSKGKIRIKGDLNDLPFSQPAQGDFRISVQVAQGRYAYVPPLAKNKPSAWPALVDLSGELVFERKGMQFKGSTHVDGAPGIAWSAVEAHIADFAHAQVRVQGEGHGPLGELLGVVSKGGLNDLLNQALAKAQGNGEADYKLALELPLDHLERSKVQGSVMLAGNDVQAIAGTPVLTQARGQVQFSEQGFALNHVRGRMLGGDADLEGGLRFGARDGDSPLQLRIRGTLSADGLRQARELGFVARLASRATGRASYQATVGLRRNQAELSISSDLKGMALNLPAPLGKPATTSLPLQVETQLTRDTLAPRSKLLQDQLRVTLGRVLSVAYLRDLSKPDAAVLQGGMTVGQVAGGTPFMAPGGVALNIQWPSLDLDAWNDVLSEWTGVASVVRPGPRGAQAAKGRQVIGGVEASGGNPMDYVPSTLALVADQVRVADRVVHKVIAGGSRAGEVWRLNVAAEELNGAIELRPASGNTPVQFYARLSHLVVPPSLVSDVDKMLSTQPSSIPALDVVVNDFTLRDKKLGRLEVDAVNRAGRNAATREWVLNKLNLQMPEATFSAKGNWAADGPRQRRTQLDFTLTIRDSGDLLARLGMPGVVRDGAGKIEGQLGWQGSPLAPDYPSLAGQFNVNVEKGQFLKTEPGVGRLLGILNLQALPRRLTLDFSDVFYEGFAFDFFRGDVRVAQGVAATNNLQMKGVAAAALIEGQSDLARETQDLKVVVVPDINAGNASLYMATINPLIGLTSYLAQLVLSKPLIKANTTELHIDGTWRNPRVTKVDS